MRPPGRFFISSTIISTKGEVVEISRHPERQVDHDLITLGDAIAPDGDFCRLFLLRSPAGPHGKPLQTLRH